MAFPDRSRLSRRSLLKASAAGGLVAATGGISASFGQGAPVNFTSWSAAVDQVRSHVSAFERATGLKVNYENFPWAQYRTSVVTRLVGNAPMDVLWVSDAWLPEFAEAGWLATIDDVPELMKYNADAAQFCTQSMVYKGKQYGLAYYGDHMSFIYNTEILQKAGITTPPTTWEEVVQQSLKIKQSGGPEFPMLMALGIDTWLIEFMSALVFAHGGRFVDASGNAIMADAAAAWWRRQPGCARPSTPTRSSRRAPSRPPRSMRSGPWARASTPSPSSRPIACAPSTIPRRPRPPASCVPP